MYVNNIEDREILSVEGFDESDVIRHEIGYGGPTVKEPKIIVFQEVLKLIAEIDEFKGKWEALKSMSPERLRQLCKVATIESIGSSIRIESSK